MLLRPPTIALGWNDLTVDVPVVYVGCSQVALAGCDPARQGRAGHALGADRRRRHRLCAARGDAAGPRAAGIRHQHLPERVGAVKLA
eukprot:ctg_740.g179